MSVPRREISNNLLVAPLGFPVALSTRNRDFVDVTSLAPRWDVLPKVLPAALLFPGSAAALPNLQRLTTVTLWFIPTYLSKFKQLDVILNDFFSFLGFPSYLWAVGVPPVCSPLNRVRTCHLNLIWKYYRCPSFSPH